MGRILGLFCLLSTLIFSACSDDSSGRRSGDVGSDGSADVAADSTDQSAADGTEETGGDGAIEDTSADGPAADVEDDVTVSRSCPTAAINASTSGRYALNDGELRMDVQDILYLSGEDSVPSDPETPVLMYDWSFEESPNDEIAFDPPASQRERDVQIDPVWPGEYEIYLDVWDESGARSCEPAVLFVFAFHVEYPLVVQLNWDTPGDTNRNDVGPGLGSDLSVHVLHQSGEGVPPRQEPQLIPSTTDLDGDDEPDGWFSSYDCYWGRATEWSCRTVDDSDGWGPDRVDMRAPIEEATYRIGVDYFTDNGFGGSTATLQLIHDEGGGDRTVVFETSADLLEGDFWEVADVTWPSLEYTIHENDDGDPLVTPDIIAIPAD